MRAGFARRADLTLIMYEEIGTNSLSLPLLQAQWQRALSPTNKLLLRRKEKEQASNASFLHLLFAFSGYHMFSRTQTSYFFNPSVTGPFVTRGLSERPARVKAFPLKEL